jgi:serine/threonine-protein kinase
MGQLLHRWARREPALVAHLVTLGGCTLIAQASYQFVPGHIVALQFHLLIIGILAGWMACSYVCQILARNPARTETMRFVWVWLDVAFFSFILFVDNAFTGPLVVGYPVLIAASGLWFRDAIVWFTTAMAMLSYAALLVFGWEDANDLHKHVMFLISLAVTGFIVTYQVRRVRALSRYYERRFIS